MLWGDSVHRKGLYGGTPEEQATEFQYMMTYSPFVMRCWPCVVGMVRCVYLEQLDYAAIRKYRKAFIGYSDCTALHMAINRYSQLITYHGPMG